MLEIKEKEVVGRTITEDDGKMVPASGLTLADIEALGLTMAAENLKKEVAIADNPELKRKLRTAFEFYRVVEPEKLKAFNEKLKKKLLVNQVRTDYHGNKVRVQIFNQLHFCKIEEYPTLPPKDVLLALREAKEHKCFDQFLIATLQPSKEETVIPVPKYRDPILFGMIKESPNLYFIAQWDDDVKIEDILKEGEG